LPIWFNDEFKMCFTLTDIYFKALKERKKKIKEFHEEQNRRCMQKVST